jgi:hypothetical protein
MMRTFPARLAVLAALTALLVGSAATALASPAAAQPHWTSATRVPGIGGDWSEPFSVSCTGPGDCAAGGEYGPDEPYTQSLPFVVTETGGTWGPATTVAPIPALGGLQYAAVTSVSCAWPGNCAAVGYYLTHAAGGVIDQGFGVNEINGVWHQVRALNGVFTSENVNALGPDWTLTVSCAPATTRAARSAGLNCLAVGAALIHGHDQAFVAWESRDWWGPVQPVPGLARLGGTRPSQVNAVSCAGLAACAIGGYYTDAKGRRQAFAAAEAGGRWPGAVEVPGTGALNVKGSAEVDAVDCPARGNCTAVGDYRAKNGAAEFFFVRAAWADWHGTTAVPGLARLGHGGDLTGNSGAELSCTPAACAVGVTLDTTTAGGTAGFLTGETNGRWSAPHRVPGTDSTITAVACPRAGDCVAGGNAGSPGGGIVLDQANGAWGKPVTVDPASFGMSGQLTALSCAAVRNCGAVGYLPLGDEAGPWAAVATEGRP